MVHLLAFKGQPLLWLWYVSTVKYRTHLNPYHQEVHAGAVARSRRSGTWIKAEQNLHELSVWRCGGVVVGWCHDATTTHTVAPSGAAVRLHTARGQNSKEAKGPWAGAHYRRVQLRDQMS